jgi:HEAT repeat protein
LQVRAFVHVVQALAQEGSRLIGVKAFSATDEEMLPLIRIASDANVTDFGAVIPGLIKKPALRAAAVAAAGVLKAKVAVNELMALCRDEDRLLARAAMVSLLQIADPASIGTAQAMVFADDLMTRKAAIKLLAKFPEQAVSTAAGHMAASDEYRARIGIELMAEVGTPAALEMIGDMLLDPRPGVRIECLLRLNGRCPAKFRADYLSLGNDPVGTVKSVAAACEPGNVQ